jgi:hypothetical protein
VVVAQDTVLEVPIQALEAEVVEIIILDQTEVQELLSSKKPKLSDKHQEYGI